MLSVYSWYNYRRCVVGNRVKAGAQGNELRISCHGDWGVKRVIRESLSDRAIVYLGQPVWRAWRG